MERKSNMEENKDFLSQPPEPPPLKLTSGELLERIKLNNPILKAQSEENKKSEKKAEKKKIKTTNNQIDLF